MKGKLFKLRAMSAREVASRLQYKVVLAVERQAHGRGALAHPDRLHRALRDGFRGEGWQRRLLAARAATRARFFPGVHSRARMRELFETAFAAERQAALAQAGRARENRFEFFGQEFHYPQEIDWQADPVSGRRWPAVFHADVPVHGGDVGFGDVKHVWELSRQQYLIDLAKAHFLTDSSADRASLERLVRSWIAGNPYATGVNWACALEPAFRAWSWLWAYHLTADALDEAFHIEWLRGLYDHGRFLARHLELYSSPYNHLIGEASALYALGLCFPEFRESDRWARQALAVLEGRLGEQFYRDGGSVEQSTFYHHATTGFYLLAGLLGRANARDPGPDVWKAVERALEFSMHLMQPDGRTPEIGGADDGKPIRMEHLPFWDFRPYLAIGAVLFNRADFKAAAGRFYEDALWLLGPEGLDVFDALQASPPAETVILLGTSGYSVGRSDRSEKADYVCFDVGEQAAGMRTDAVPNSMHGHADCLAVIAWLGGRRVLVDPGLYAYNCGGEWEAHFRETAAHNTARIDGRDQARHLGKMAWSHSYRPRIEGHYADARQWWTLASHDGYARGPEGVTHRRAVWRRPDGCLLVYDEFVGAGVHELEVNWQFAPGALELDGGGRARFDGAVELVWAGSCAWSARTCCGGPGPADGWVCPSLGVREPAPRLTLRAGMTGGRASLLTMAVTLAGARSRVSLSGHPGAHEPVGVQGDGWIDWIAAAGVTRAKEVETDAPLAVLRLWADGEIERARLGGTFLRADAAALDARRTSLVAAR